jgi:hypothetical protein
MSIPAPYADDIADEWTTESESGAKFWLDDELLDEMAEIINENFVLEVKASLRLRG